MVRLLAALLLAIPLASGAVTSSAASATSDSCGLGPKKLYYGTDKNQWDSCILTAGSAFVACPTSDHMKQLSCQCSLASASWNCIASACPTATQLSGILSTAYDAASIACGVAGVKWGSSGQGSTGAAKTGSASAAAGSAMASSSSSSSSNGGVGNLAGHSSSRDSMVTVILGFVGASIGAAAVLL